MSNVQQLFLWDNLQNLHNEEYVEMPEYDNINKPDAKITCTFKFRNEEDYEKFKTLAREYIYEGQRFIDGNQSKTEQQAWYPLNTKESHYVTKSNKNLKQRFPIYIVSKGRWQNNPTRETLKRMNVSFFMIVEKQEYNNYAKFLPKENLLILPQHYKNKYDTFWKDMDKRVGPGPARNFAWEHSIKKGFDWHWVMDDNIESFHYFNKNIRSTCIDSSCFYICEDFVMRYKNIAISGLNYANFCHRHEGVNKRPPLIFNTRIYSCLLIRNDIPYRWRGRYNEDTDLSIRVMKDGWCTVQFSNFLQGKMSTQKIKGGNTDEFYKEEGTLKKSKMLVDMHPDITRLTKKFNRWHHHVNYKVFKKNSLLRCENFIPKNKVNDYGLKTFNIGKKFK